MSSKSPRRIFRGALEKLSANKSNRRHQHNFKLRNNDHEMGRLNKPNPAAFRLIKSIKDRSEYVNILKNQRQNEHKNWRSRMHRAIAETILKTNHDINLSCSELENVDYRFPQIAAIGFPLLCWQMAVSSVTELPQVYYRYRKLCGLPKKWVSDLVVSKLIERCDIYNILQVLDDVNYVPSGRVMLALVEPLLLTGNYDAFSSVLTRFCLRGDFAKIDEYIIHVISRVLSSLSSHCTFESDIHEGEFRVSIALAIQKYHDRLSEEQYHSSESVEFVQEVDILTTRKWDAQLFPINDDRKQKIKFNFALDESRLNFDLDQTDQIKISDLSNTILRLRPSNYLLYSSTLWGGYLAARERNLDFCEELIPKVNARHEQSESNDLSSDEEESEESIDGSDEYSEDSDSDYSSGDESEDENSAYDAEYDDELKDHDQFDFDGNSLDENPKFEVTFQLNESNVGSPTFGPAFGSNGILGNVMSKRTGLFTKLSKMGSSVTSLFPFNDMQKDINKLYPGKILSFDNEQYNDTSVDDISSHGRPNLESSNDSKFPNGPRGGGVTNPVGVVLLDMDEVDE